MAAAKAWGNYIITGIVMSADGEHIDKLCGYEIYFEHGSPKYRNYKTWTRREVVALIERGKVFTTATANASGDFTLGAEIHIVEVKTKFLRSEKDATDKDNLGSLPRC